MTTETSPQIERCLLCGSDDRPLHDELIANHVIHHQWSPSGDLKPVERADRQAPKVQRVPTVIGGIDLDLRQILLEKGIVTNADFTALRNPGSSPSGDREAGEAPSSE